MGFGGIGIGSVSGVVVMIIAPCFVLNTLIERRVRSRVNLFFHGCPKNKKSVSRV